MVIRQDLVPVRGGLADQVLLGRGHREGTRSGHAGVVGGAGEADLALAAPLAVSVYDPTRRLGRGGGRVPAPWPSVWRDCQPAVLLPQLKLPVSSPPNPPAVTEIVPLTGADAGETVTAA